MKYLFNSFNLLLQNEEALNLKEELRSEVMKDLERVEKMHTDMASILRGLGICVEGGLFPTLNQVFGFVLHLLYFHTVRSEL
jgi:hypothetical protein